MPPLTSKIDVVNQMATLFHRAIGCISTTTTKSTNSVITRFTNDELVVILLMLSRDEYQVIFQKDEYDGCSFAFNYNDFFKTITLPVEPREIDTMYMNYKGDITKTFIFNLFVHLGSYAENVKPESVFKKGLFDNAEEKFFGGYFTDIPTDNVPTFTDSEMEILKYMRLRPMIGSLLLFPNDLKNVEVVGSKKKFQKKKKKSSSKIKEVVPDDDETGKSVDSYPLFRPSPLSGF